MEHHNSCLACQACLLPEHSRYDNNIKLKDYSGFFGGAQIQMIFLLPFYKVFFDFPSQYALEKRTRLKV
jgi:hypothetical protein